MAQTPKSASVQYNSTTPVTMYTVPTGATAVVKTVIAQSQVTDLDVVTVNKVYNGVTYPLVVNSYSATPAGTYYAQTWANNLLQGPITLAAGETLSISTSSAAYYKFPKATIPTSTGFRIYNLNYLNGNYIAVGKDVGLGVGLILTSPNGTTWTRQTFNYAIGINDIGFDGTNYVVVGASNGGFLYRSTDLVNWTQTAAPNSNNMNCITYGNGKWVAGGVSGSIWYSSNATTWTAATFTYSSTINTVLTIGTNWVFGTAGAYGYTADFSTFYVPNYLANINRNYIASDAAGKIYVTNTNYAAVWPTNCLYTSSNNGKTLTAADFSALASLPNMSVVPVVAPNGGRVLYPIDLGGGVSTYLSSANGTTWSVQNIPGSYSGTNTYVSNLFPVGSTYNAMAGIQLSTRFMIYTINSSGVLTQSLQFANNQAYISAWDYGVYVPAGNPTTGTWIAMGVQTNNTSYIAYQYGNGTNNGSDAQYTQFAWYTGSFGYPYCAMYKPATNGYFCGTSSGWVISNSSTTTAFGNGVQIFTNGSPVVGLAANGNTATSKIVAISGDGYSCFSVDQGVTWTSKKLVTSSGFNANPWGSTTNLTYSNGYWYAVSQNNIIYYTADGITWNAPPYNVQYATTLNSLNIFINNISGLIYTTGTTVDAFTATSTTTNFTTSYPSVRRMTYVGGTYYIGAGSTMFSSTDLSTWRGNSFNTTRINNVDYIDPSGNSNSTAAIAYSGSGSSILVTGALLAASQDNASFSVPTVSSLALVTGSATASIVEIT